MKYTGSYRFLAEHLSSNGYVVYPHEIVCGWLDCPHEQNRAVDVAAFKDGSYYAFEYKSSRDRLLRAVKQVENYRESFDYIIVVAEVPRYDISVNPKKGKRIKEILNLGAGLWTIQFRHVLPRMGEMAKTSIIKTFKDISLSAPIESHEVLEESDGNLTSNRDMWFWFFYSVLDRRSNASTFYLAKAALENERLFSPFSIIQLVQSKGKDGAIRKIGRVLRKVGFPLLKDHFMGDLSHPRSIVEAAQFMSKHDFSFEKLYDAYLSANDGDLIRARDALWKTLKKQIYGVGERIASQFIRGMVLKGPWAFPLNDDRFLEKCKFNVHVAIKLGLITGADKYYEDLGDFADNYLGGNRGIIAHVLWYVRKRYCPRCYTCPLFDFCRARGITKYEFTEIVAPKRQEPNPNNKRWIDQKFRRYVWETRKADAIDPLQRELGEFMQKSGMS